jgi:hypothetical protein
MDAHIRIIRGPLQAKEVCFAQHYCQLKTGFFADKIQGLYYVNPDSRQFWPIFDDTISNSQGNLVNDYGY